MRNSLLNAFAVVQNVQIVQIVRKQCCGPSESNAFVRLPWRNPFLNFATSSNASVTVNAVDGVNFSVQRGEIFTLLGPSGCGKTTTLRLVAGLEEPDDGEIYIDGKIVAAPQRGLFLPPEKRQLGMVFQSYAIWPHLTVFENVAFPFGCDVNPPT